MRKSIDRLPLKVLLAATPIFCVLAMVALGLVVRSGTSQVTTQLDLVTRTIVPQYDAAMDLAASMRDAHTKALRAVMWSAAGISAEKILPLTNEAQSIATRVGEEAATAMAGEAGAGKLAEEVKANIALYQKALADAIDLIDDPAVATGLFRKADQHSQTVLGLLDQFATSKRAAFASSIGAAETISGETSQTFLGAIIACVLLVGAGVTWISRAIARPIRMTTDAMAALAQGNLSQEIPFKQRTDEIGVMAKTLQVFRDNLAETDQIRAEQSIMEKRNAEMRQAEMVQLATGFEQSVGKIVSEMRNASSKMENVAERLSGDADKTTAQATTVAAASEQASSNVATVAAATEELSSSVREIGQQVDRSNSIIEKATAAARETSQQVNSLGHAASQITGIVSFINEIASQTNLLALNATIEAARAGDSGKGFAVVAAEVKALATQTAKATADIDRQIKDIQDLTRGTTDTMHCIAETISEVSAIAASISSAVEEQSAATTEIAQNIDRAATGAADVAENIGEVHVVAQHTSTSAADMLGSARSLSRQSNSLSQEIDAFIARVRAA